MSLSASKLLPDFSVCVAGAAVASASALGLTADLLNTTYIVNDLLLRTWAI